MSKAEFQQFYVDYLLGEADAVTSERLKQHLAECAECRSELAELAEALHNLPLALEPVPPSPEVKDRLLASLPRQPQDQIDQPRSSSGWKGWRLAAAAAVVIALLLGGWLVRLQQESLAKDRHIASLLAEVEALRNANGSLILKVNSLSRPSVRLLTLAGLKDYGESSASAFVQPEDSRVSLFFHGLPAIPDDREFQLWIIEEGQPPHPSRTFRASGPVTELEADLPVDPGKVQVLAVTIEPDGGSQQPTGPMVMAGGP